MTKTLLITGGAGFIGSNFVKHILNKYPDYKIINLDKLTYAGNLNNLKDIEKNERYSFIKGDICDQKLVFQIVRDNQVNFIINFAAESHVDRSIDDSNIFIETNIKGTQVLLDATREFEIERFLQVSTDEVYGSLGETGLFSEETPLSPNSPYSACKASADCLVRASYHTFKLPVLITRCSNNYGPYQFPEKLIPLIIKNALTNQELPVYGDGKNVRDWLYVQDHCEAIDIVLHQGRVGEVYNIGGNNEMKNIEIVRIILQELKKPESLIKYVKDRLGHDLRYAINASKIKKELGWEPRYGFEQAIRETIRWYVENRHWWERIINEEYKQYYADHYLNKKGIE